MQQTASRNQGTSPDKRRRAGATQDAAQHTRSHPVVQEHGFKQKRQQKAQLKVASGHNSKGTASPSYQVLETGEVGWGSDCTKKRLRFFVRTPLLRLNSSLSHHLRTAPSMVVHGLNHVSNSNHRARPKNGRGRARTQRNTYTPVTWGEINLR